MYDYLCKYPWESVSSVSDRAATDTCLVLQYHRVASLCFDPQQLTVEPHHFEEQMAYLAENCNVIPIDDMRRHLDTSRLLKQRTVVITFDGGYSDVLYTAKDVLRRFDLPATVFATSANIIDGGRFWWQNLEDYLIANHFEGQLEIEIDSHLHRWPLLTQFDRCRAYEDLYGILLNKAPSERKRLSEEIGKSIELHAEELDTHRTMSVHELRKLVDGGLITVGGHTHSGAKLSSLPKCDQIDEIMKNKEILEEVLKCPIECFSYPLGNCDNDTRETGEFLEDAGFAMACGGSYGAAGISGRTSRYDLPRVKVGNWNTFAFHRFLRRFFD